MTGLVNQSAVFNDRKPAIPPSHWIVIPFRDWQREFLPAHRAFGAVSLQHLLLLLLTKGSNRVESYANVLRQREAPFLVILLDLSARS